MGAVSLSPERPAATHQPPRILCVGGFSRSGSTLLGRVLGEADGALCVGETHYLWERGVIHNVRCGCGEHFLDCRFWCAVGQHAFGGWENVEVERLAASDRTINRLRSLPFHHLPSLRPAFTAAVGDYAAALARLYRAIAEVSGASTLIDTSKDPNFARTLTAMEGYDVRIVHLVRDPRAVACSWVSPKRLAHPIAGERFMPTFTVADTATRWMLTNGAFHTLAARLPYTRLTYEDFVARPQAALDALGGFTAQPLSLPAGHLDRSGVKLGRHHIFSGNPMSALTGRVGIYPDGRWKRELSGSQVARVTALTWPLLRRYGYPITGARGDAGS